VAVRPRHSRGRGQHFLRSSKLAAELVRAAGIRREDLVLDLGAGTGALTAALVRRGASVVAVEIDTELAAGLRRRFPEVRVIEDDLQCFALPHVRFKVVANLPFGCATAILRRLLDPRALLESADVIVEWDMAAKRASVWPGTQLSTYWGAWFELSLARRLPGSVLRRSRRSTPAYSGSFGERSRSSRQRTVPPMSGSSREAIAAVCGRL
jgi:23S rRNA (adenine-N6)-dimethyltransferase